MASALAQLLRLMVRVELNAHTDVSLGCKRPYVSDAIRCEAEHTGTVDTPDQTAIYGGTNHRSIVTCDASPLLYRYVDIE